MFHVKHPRTGVWEGSGGGLTRAESGLARARSGLEGVWHQSPSDRVSHGC